MPTDRSQAVKVEGLKDFQRELRSIDTKLPRELTKANKNAAELVASRARHKAASQGGVASKTAPSIKAAAEQRRSKVNIGGLAFPFALGAEFGSKQYLQFKHWRGNRHDEGMEPGSGVGWFLYPTIRETRDEYIEIYTRSINEVMRKAFPA